MSQFQFLSVSNPIATKRWFHVSPDVSLTTCYSHLGLTVMDWNGHITLMLVPPSNVSPILYLTIYDIVQIHHMMYPVHYMMDRGVHHIMDRVHHMMDGVHHMMDTFYRQIRYISGF